MQEKENESDLEMYLCFLLTGRDLVMFAADKIIKHNPSKPTKPV